MPIYQYVCPECKQEIEIIQKINDEHRHVTNVK